MSRDASTYVCRALKVMRGALGPFVESRLKSRFGDLWRDEVAGRLDNSRCPALDSYGSLKIMKVFWQEAFGDLGRFVLADVRKTLSVRNQHAHDEVFNRKEAKTALVTMNRLLQAISKKEIRAQRFIDKIDALQQELNVESQPRADKKIDAPRFVDKVDSSRQELDAEPQLRTDKAKLGAGASLTTSRPQMFPYLEDLVRKVEMTSAYRQHLFDSELRDMLNEARERGEQKVRIVSKELCFRVVDDYVDGVMVMSSDAMWTVWEWQGNCPERVVYKSKGGFSNLLQIEFDTDNLPPEK